jgi:signal peptidase
LRATGSLRSYRSGRQRKPLAAARRALHVAWAIACICTLLTAIATAVATAALHLVPLAVTSGSMEPVLQAHSMILVKEVDADDVRVGDIITFDPPGSTTRVTHRVVARQRSGSHWYFQTKGDANPARDDWRRGLEHSERYRADVTYGNGPAIRHIATIPHVGWISVLGTVPLLRTVLVLLPFVLVAVCLLAAIWRRPGRADGVARGARRYPAGSGRSRA